MNTYAYVAGNPLKYADADGEGIKDILKWFWQGKEAVDKAQSVGNVVQDTKDFANDTTATANAINDLSNCSSKNCLEAATDRLRDAQNKALVCDPAQTGKDFVPLLPAP